MDSLLYAALLSAVVAFLCAPKLIPILRKMKFGQSIREEGPESHYVKAGTPTIYFNSGLPHGMKALDGDKVRFLAIII